MPAENTHHRLRIQNFYLQSEGERLVRIFQKNGLGCLQTAEEDASCCVVFLGESTPWQEALQYLQTCAAQDLRTVCVGLFNRPLEHFKMWELLEAGADEFLPWHFIPDPEKALLARLDRWKTVSNLLDSPRVRDLLVGNSRVWLRFLREVIEAACFSQSPVLVLGESGVGKELVARLIHTLDSRPDKRDLVVTDCTAIVPELSGSEFFGHEKGAFTNALNSRDGAFALADGGTLFLDEIGELPLPLQAELLRVIQEGMYKRVGGNHWRQTQFRLVSATNRDVRAWARAGTFREDLFYRISTTICHVPPLRDRREDIVPLAEHFFKKIMKTDAPPPLDEAVKYYLITREYRGNVRELQQLVARIASRHPNPRLPVTLGDIPEADRPSPRTLQNPWDLPEFENALRIAMTNGIGLKEIKRCVANKAMDLAIGDEAGNLQAAAQRLQVSDRSLQIYQASLKEGGVAMGEDV